MSILDSVRSKFKSPMSGTDKADIRPSGSSVSPRPKENENYGQASVASVSTSPEEIQNLNALADRIRAMADRWQYSDAELAEALAGATADPDSWTRWVEHDEALNRYAR